MGLGSRLYGAGEAPFGERLSGPGAALGMHRPGFWLGQPQAAHPPRHGLRAHALAEALLDEAAQVRQGPARRLAFLRVGTAQDAVDQHRLLPLGETLRSTTV